MNDVRWLDVHDQLQSALENFHFASEIKKASSLSTNDFERKRDDLAIMHALQIAHRSVEQAIVRVLRILKEEEPNGEDWHADLLRRAGLEIRAGHYARPAILPDSVVEDLQETRRFRHVATNSYDSFRMDRVDPTLAAVERLKSSLLPAFESFQEIVDAYEDTNDAEPEPSQPPTPSAYRPR